MVNTKIHGNRFIDLTGKKFGNLFVIGCVGKNNRKSTIWKCKCDCGNEHTVASQELRAKHTQSCGCLRLKCIRKLPYQWLHSALIRNAKRNGHKCDITYEQFIEFTKLSKCHYCGNKIIWPKHSIDKLGKYQLQRYNLDRKDNEKGYSIDNCVICCKLCNKIKSNIFSYDEMIEVGKILSKRNQNA